MPNFNFTTNVNKINQTHFDVPSQTAETLRAIAINELETNTRAGLYTLGELSNAILTKISNPPKFTSLINEFYTGVNNKTFLNTPNYNLFNIRFEPTAYINSFGQQDTTPELEIQICNIDPNLHQNFAKTNLVNQKGTVKQATFEDDTYLTISGIMLGYLMLPNTINSSNPLGGMPVQDMQSLIEIYRSKVAVNVTSDFLNIIGVNKIVIENLHLPQNTDWKNVQQFTIQCVSDSDDIAII